MLESMENENNLVFNILKLWLLITSGGRRPYNSDCEGMKTVVASKELTSPNSYDLS